MANALYDKAREAFLNGDLDWTSDTIKVVLVDTEVENYEYVVDITSDQYLSDVPSQARVATATLASKTATAGVADAADVTFSSVSNSGRPCQALIIYKDTGSESTSPLIAYIDAGVSLPVTPNGSDIVLEWSDVYSRIFKL
ncbi:MAG: hypothetical protein K8S97_16325 [Anaerolineae bacterium]|nr:hypothetical protein [Anaerolineae bacterium]